MNAFIYVGLSSVDRNRFLNTGYDNDIKLVCECLGVSFESAVSPTRKRNVVECRFILMHILRNNYNLTLYRIAKIFNRDHSSVIYGLDTFNELMKFSPEFKSKVSKIMEAIKSSRN